MKKLLIILGIVVILAGLAGTGYWYWQNQVPAMQKVALDNANVKSFDDVCRKDDRSGNLNCYGNIEQFGCKFFQTPGFTTTDLQPTLPIIICENRISSKDYQDVYVQDSTPGVFSPLAVDFIIIRDGYFQLIKSPDQFRKVFQPITSVAEATAYFQALHKAVLILDTRILDTLKSSTEGQYLVSPDTFMLSSVKDAANGFTINTYSGDTLRCIKDLYSYTFLLQSDGSIVQQSKTLLWHNEKGFCFS